MSKSLDRKALYDLVWSKPISTVAKEYGHEREVWIESDEDKVSFKISKYIKQYRRELTEEEKKRYSTNQKWTQERKDTGKLEIILDGENSYHKAKIQENEEVALEGMLNEVIIKIIEVMWGSRCRRLEREESERKRREEDQVRYKLRLASEAESKRKLNLEYKALSWKRAQLIREYIEEVRKAVGQGKLEFSDSEFEEWSLWAMKHADSLDFITNGNPLINLTGETENLFNFKQGELIPDYNHNFSDGSHPWNKWYNRRD